MGQDNSDEFFIGYGKEMPAGIARHLRKTVAGIGVAVVILAVMLVLAQQAFYPSVYEFGVFKNFSGLIETEPYPTILIGEDAGGRPELHRYYLVSAGKKGAQDLVREMDGRMVSLKGSLIYRDQQRMIEIDEGALTPAEDLPVPTPARGRPLGEYTLSGEITDSKCFFGVMNPGYSKVHRACAVRCISGGITPVLAVKDAAGNNGYFILADSEGRMVNKDVLDLVGEPVTVSGQVVQYDNLFVLQSDPGTYRRVN